MREIQPRLAQQMFFLQLENLRVGIDLAADLEVPLLRVNAEIFGFVRLGPFHRFSPPGGFALPNRRIRQGTGSAGNEAYNTVDNSLRDGVQAPPAAGVSKALFFSKIVTASFLC
jgi:hypothetical protein